MPDESTNSVGTSQASQNNQSTTNQSGNDFILDFGDLGDNDTPVTEEVHVDSLSEEENSGDELNFDIDLGTTDQDSSENTEETKSEADNGAANNVSIDTSEDTVNDFDISMDYEGTSEEEESTPENTEEVEQEGDRTGDNEEMAQDEEKLSGDEKVIDEEPEEDEEMVPNGESSDEEEIIQDDALTFTIDDTNPEEKTENSGEKVSEEELVEDNEEMLPEEEISDNNEIIPDEVLSFSTADGGSEETIDDNEEIVPDEGGASDESEMFGQDEKVDDTISENSESQNSEGHLFHQINEGDQNEMSFDFDYSDNNQSFQTDENTTNKPLFMSADDANIYEPEGQEGEITFNLPEVSDNIEGSTELDIEPETQKQPELGDLLSNSPIDLSKELNEGPEENIESNLGNMETPVDGVEAVNDLELQETSSDSVTFEPVVEDAISEEILNEVPSETVLDVVAPEVVSQDAEPETAMPVENNNFLLDAPQVDHEAQRAEETVQPENVENNVEIQSQQSQTDERSEAINNAAAEMSDQNVATPEINISSPVELSNVSSSQRENVPVESENQVQSTLSLDQILDSELLTNPQYTDNSKASPQNAPVSGGKGKIGLFIGVGVAALACCVAVLAFPSISGERKPGDKVDTGISMEYPTEDEEPFGSAPEEPTDRQNPITEEPEPTGDQQTYTPDVSDLPGVGGGGQVVILPDDEDDGGDDETGTEPVPYVWSGDGDIDDPEIETPVIEEVDAGQILDIILSFKSQADTYYSHGEQTADKQLMKYALRLITVCDNYTDKVNNGEGVDPESLSTFKSTANKILSKINTYLGGDEDVPVIREATIDGESYFEGKDELKEYIYNNR